MTLQDYQNVLDKEGLVLPVFEADARSKEDILLLLDMLMAVVEMNQPNINIEDSNEQHDPLLSF